MAKGLGTKGIALVIGIALVAVIGTLFLTGNLKMPTASVATIPTATQAGATGAGTVAIVGQGCNQNPAYAYSAVDYFTGATVGGTNQIRLNGNYPVTTLAAPTYGLPIEYWLNNATYFCTPMAQTVECGSKSMQLRCLNNGSVTLKLFDIANNVFLVNGVGAGTNITIGANENPNLKIAYQGTAKHAAMPYGGCMIVEYPTTISTVSVSGQGLTDSCPYQVTYAVHSTSNTYKAFGVPTGFDANGAGDYKEIAMQLKASATNPSGTGYIDFLGADRYVVSETGEIVLGIEQDKNSLTTRTGTDNLFTFSIK